MIVTSLNYWSAPGGLEGTLDPIEFMRRARAAGFEAVELAVGPPRSALPVDIGEGRCREIVGAAADLGLGLPSLASGLYWAHSLGDDDPSSRRQARDELAAMIEIAHRLGARTLLVIPGSVDVFFMPERPRQAWSGVWERASEGLAELVPSAGDAGVRLGIENVWNRFLVSALDVESFVDQFRSPWVGAYVDVANVLAFGYAQDWLRRLNHRVVGVHFKDFRRAVGTAEGFVDLLAGDVDWPEVADALRDIGYDGPVVAELLPPYRHFGSVRLESASRAMDAILGRI